MPTIVTRRTTQGQGGSTARMVISAEGTNLALAVPYAPRSLAYGARGRPWTTLDRAGRAPLLTSGSLALPTLGFDLFLGSTDPYQDVEAALTTLEQLAATAAPLVVAFGPSAAGRWRMTALSYTSQALHPDTDAVTQAIVSIELTRASDAAAATGPLSGGHSGGKGAGGGTYVVKKGDTLHKISVKFYDTPKHWRYIAKVNKIRDPKRAASLKPGRKLTIPKLRKGKG